MLKNNPQTPAPTLQLDPKQPQADLTITAQEGLFVSLGDKKNVVRENHDPFKLIATGGSTDHAVQWSLTNGEGIVTINESTGEITLTNKAFGDVTVTATKPGNDAYSDTTASFTFYVISHLLFYGFIITTAHPKVTTLFVTLDILIRICCLNVFKSLL